MDPYCNPLPKTGPKLAILSSPKIFPINYSNESFEKQKSLSYNENISDAYSLVHKKQMNYQGHNNQGQTNVSKQKYQHLNSFQFLQQKKIQNNIQNHHYNRHKLYSESSSFGIEKHKLFKRHSDDASHNNPIDPKTPRLNLQSLRYTITNPYSNNFNGPLSPDSKKICLKQSKFFTCSTNREKLVPRDLNMLRDKKKSFLKPNIIDKLENSTVKQNIDETCINKQIIQKLDTNIKKKHERKYQNKIFFQTLADKINQKKKQNNVQSSQNAIDKSKGRKDRDRPQDFKVFRKFPSFLSSKNQQKQNLDRVSKQAKKYPIYEYQMDKIRQGLTPQNNKIRNAKHAKSLSTFQTLRMADKKDQYCQKSSLFQGFQLQQRKQVKKQNELSSKAQQFEKIDQQKGCLNVQNLKKRLNFENNQQVDIFSNQKLDQKAKHVKIVSQKQRDCSKYLRHSLDSFHYFQKQLELIKSNRKQTLINKEVSISSINYVQSNLPQQNPKIKDNKTHNPHAQQSHNENVCKQVKGQFDAITQKQSQKYDRRLQTIDDIKQALINCNLFSEQDYDDVFKVHQKDILNSKAFRKAQRVKFKEDKLLHRTSLKDLVDPQENLQCDKSRLSSQEQKKLAELVSMSEQKRSRWILEQTDTIKESLKQLSQFNTQKSLYQNQWKKISMKDFTSAKKMQKQADINEIKQEFYFQAEQKDYHAKIEQAPNSQLFSRSSKVKSRKQKSSKLKVGFQENKEICPDPILQNVSIDDFQIKWRSSELIFQDMHSVKANNTVVTYWARHKQLGAIFSIKKYEQSLFANINPIYLDAFIQKIRIQMMSINHANIQKIYGFFSDKRHFYLISQFVEGNLGEILKQTPKQPILNSSQKKISINLNFMSSQKKRVSFLSEIIDGVQQIHANHFIHKSLQPLNIGLIFDTCKISGFESAQNIQKQPNAICNEYICPQILFDSVKSAMDIWCLGILTYEILIGKRPFQQSKHKNDNSKMLRNILECNFDIPAEQAFLCGQIVSLALKRNPKQRASIFEIKSKWNKRVQSLSKQIWILKELTKDYMKIFD